MTADPPILLARRLPCGCCLAAYCPHCRRDHVHGGDAGHRTAHCASDRSPYAQDGYELVLTAESADRAVVQ